MSDPKEWMSIHGLKMEHVWLVVPRKDVELYQEKYISIHSINSGSNDVKDKLNPQQ
jgi:hypothetical protein